MKSIILFLLMASPAMAFDVMGNLPTALGDGRYVLKTGDTMSGPLTLSGSSLTVTGAGIYNTYGIVTGTAAVEVMQFTATSKNAPAASIKNNSSAAQIQHFANTNGYAF